MSLTPSALEKTPLRKLDRSSLRTLVSELLPKFSPEAHPVIDALLSFIERLWGELDLKEFRLQKLLREHFGRTSEKLDATQLLLFIQQLATESGQPAGEEGVEVPAVPDEKRPARAKRTGRNPLPASLLREKVQLLPSEAERVCTECGAQMVCIGHETSEVLEYVPAHFKAIEVERVKMACKHCEDGVVIAPAGDKPIERGRPGPGLLAHILVSKFGDHQPLYRLSKQLSRAGLNIPDSTLGRWVEAGARLLEPLWLLLSEMTVSSEGLGIDDTPLKVLDRSQKPAIKRGHIWVYVGYERGSPKRMVYRYTPDWKGDDACEFLSKREGPIQSDGYAGTNRLFGKATPNRKRVGCLAHVRRKFEAAFTGGDRRAAMHMELFGRVYQVERLADSRNATPEERVALREQYARPNLSALSHWLLRRRPEIEPKSPLRKAITYAIHQWPTLLVYLTDGTLRSDNNLVEQQMRPVALGRRNYLSAGSDEGGGWAAILYTLMGCCTLAKVEPFTWL
jgi:transposase